MDQRVFSLLGFLRDQQSWAEGKKIQFRGNCREREIFYEGVAWGLARVIEAVNEAFCLGPGQAVKLRKNKNRGGKK